MYKSFVLAVLMFTGCAIIAQPVHDLDFRIVVFDDCSLARSDKPIYAKVEIDPVVHSMSRADFVAQMRLAVSHLELGDASSGTIKLKYWFTIDSSACLRAVGFHDLAATDGRSASILYNHTPNISSFTPGRQRDEAQNCEGVVLLSIDRGRIGAIRIANFGFTNN